MIEPPEYLMDSSVALRLFGSGIGAFFLALFGAAWMFLSLIAAGNIAVWLYVLAGIVAIALLLAAGMAIRKGGPGARTASNPRYRRRVRKVFGIINAIQWTAIFVAAFLLQRNGHDWLVVPAIAIIVGMHFWPLAPLFRFPLYYATGLSLVLWAIFAMIYWPRTAVPVATGLGTGVLLWTTAVIALLWAHRQPHGTIVDLR